MKLRDFRIGWRTLVKEPAYSLVVIGGLGVGLAAALLLFGFVRYSLQYNQHVPDVDQVYVVKQRFNQELNSPWFDQVPMLLRAAAEGAPGVKAVSIHIPAQPPPVLTVNVDGTLHALDALAVLPGFVDTMGVQTLQGDLKATLESPDSFAITDEAAQRLFGTSHAMGKTIRMRSKLLRVGAILRAAPSNTTFPFESVIGVNSVLEAEVREEMLTGKQGWWGSMLIRVHPGASTAAIKQALQRGVDTSPTLQNLPPDVKQRLGARKVMDIELVPLGDAHFDTKVMKTHLSGQGEHSNATVVAGLGVVAVLILALAAVNYVNLAAVRVLRRQREVAMRKVLGASVRQIVVQMVSESMLVAMLATGLGLLLAWLALPFFSELVNRKLDGMLSLTNLGAAIFLGGMLGAVTAVYPAWIAVCVRPSQVLAGRGDSESLAGTRLRRLMTVVQVATAMAFASMTLAVAWQTEFAMRASPGFDPAPLLIVDVPERVSDSVQAQGFIAALKAQAEVAGIALSADAVGRGNSWLQDLKRVGGPSVPMDIRPVSANFFELYGIKAEAGRLFDSSIDKEDNPEPVILNAISAAKLGFASPAAALGQVVQRTEQDGKVISRRVIGIAPALRFQSLRDTPNPIMYTLQHASGTTLSVRSTVPLAQLDALVRKLWPTYFPEAMVSTMPAGTILAMNYAEDARMTKLLALATGIALLIAAFGTYVLSAHTVQRRSREIVLRKLYGAGRTAIGLLIVREIGAMTLVAAMVGLPLAGLAIARYLSSYVERAPIGYWTLGFALAATLAIALVAVARHAWLAMRMKPADALRV